MDFFFDKGFENSVNLSTTNDSDGTAVADVFHFVMEPSEPSWRIAQWGSRFSLAGTKPVFNGKTVEYKNQGKLFSRTQNDDGTASLTMEIYGGNEYENPRKYGEFWPHILVEQFFTGLPVLNEFDSLELFLDWKVGFCENLMGTQTDKELHTAQITAFFTVHNLNEDSKDYKDFIWFGIPIYDYRYPAYPEFYGIDGGKEGASGKLIYVVDGAKIYNGEVKVGETYHIKHDILPFITEALTRAQTMKFLTGTKLEDLHLTSFNMGWEVTGTFNCSFTFSGLSLNGCLSHGLKR